MKAKQSTTVNQSTQDTIFIKSDSSLWDIPKEAICDNCKKHKATQNWVGDGGMMGAVHGAYSYWCECCCLKTQIKYAEDAVSRLKELKEKIKKVKCEKV